MVESDSTDTIAYVTVIKRGSMPVSSMDDKLVISSSGSIDSSDVEIVAASQGHSITGFELADPASMRLYVSIKDTANNYFISVSTVIPEGDG